MKIEKSGREEKTIYSSEESVKLGKNQKKYSKIQNKVKLKDE